MKCPVCTTTELRMAERQGIEIDYCPQCRGVWLDRGELDKIIERSAAIEQRSVGRGQEPRYDYDDDAYDYGGERRRPHRKRKGSFLDDIFDVFD